MPRGLHLSLRKAIHFEIWNEWSRNKENKYNIFSAEEYVELVKAVSKKIKAVNPEANIIAGSFNIIGNDRTWGEKKLSD